VAAVPPKGHLLDLGSSEGETLGHFAELRPDLCLYAVDLVGQPEAYPPGCRFHRADLEIDRLPWPDASLDAVTCMQLVEHLRSLRNLLSEVARLLKPGGKVFFETPHPKTTTLPSARGAFTLNFWDDSSHVQPVPTETLIQTARQAGLQVISQGISRNWIFAASYPLFLLRPASRKKYTARVHWIGWSAFVTAQRT